MNPWIAFLFCSALLILGASQALIHVYRRTPYRPWAAKFQENKTPDADASGTGLFAGMSVQF
jgi:hypothetical protein